MTAFEIDTALADIAIKKCYICEEKIKQLSKESLTEKKALQIQLGMYSLFLRAALLLYAYNGDREKRFENRKKLFDTHISAFPNIEKLYTDADQVEKEIIIAALQGEIFMRKQFLDEYAKELSQARKSNDTKRIFEFEIKTGAVTEVLKEWEDWRIKNNVYPNMFEVDNYGK